VGLVLAVVLTGCASNDGAPTRSDESPATSPARSPAATDPEPGVQKIEDIVNGLDSVVGSAETEAETAND
jgi:hypothetical protein